MTEFVFARSLVVVSQQKVVLKKKKFIYWSTIIIAIDVRRSVRVRILTSSEARQYQQNTCLHRLHIICAHPSSFSIGTEHIGQHFILSLSIGMPDGTSGQAPLCQGSRHREQNSVEQLGQWIGPRGEPPPSTPMEQTVSHPGLGHHARPLSTDTSANLTNCYVSEKIFIRATLNTVKNKRLKIFYIPLNESQTYGNTVSIICASKSVCIA